MIIKAAELGDVDAQASIIFYYIFDFYEENGNEKKLYWLKKAAENDFGSAQNLLAHFYCQGSLVPRDFDKAIYWHEKAVHNGQIDFIISLGIIYEIREQYSRAYQYYRWAASIKNLDGMFYYAMCYMKGTGVKINKKKGFRMIKEAAELGNYKAQLMIAAFYFNGEGVKFDLLKAIYLRDKALFNLGNNHEVEKTIIDYINEYCKVYGLCTMCGKKIEGKKYESETGQVCEECHKKDSDWFV